MGAPTYETALHALRERLSQRSVEHSEAVASSAAGLAEIYGCDVEAARLAGLLHDWSRDDEREELLDDARELGLDIGDVDSAVPYLLHARTGARRVAERYPDLDAAIIGAIERHTVGGAAMTELDMLVYVADMIEPARRYPGVAGLRESVGVVPLEELYRQAYRMSLMHLIEAGKHLHPATVAAWNALVDKGRR